MGPVSPAMSGAVYVHRTWCNIEMVIYPAVPIRIIQCSLFLSSKSSCEPHFEQSDTITDHTLHSPLLWGEHICAGSALISLVRHHFFLESPYSPTCVLTAQFLNFYSNFKTKTACCVLITDILLLRKEDAALAEFAEDVLGVRRGQRAGLMTKIKPKSWARPLLALRPMRRWRGATSRTLEPPDPKNFCHRFAPSHGPLHTGQKLSWPKFLNLKCLEISKKWLE